MTREPRDERAADAAATSRRFDVQISQLQPPLTGMRFVAPRHEREARDLVSEFGDKALAPAPGEGVQQRLCSELRWRIIHRRRQR